jgi:hypothetical protein
MQFLEVRSCFAVFMVALLGPGCSAGTVIGGGGPDERAGGSAGEQTPGRSAGESGNPRAGAGGAGGSAGDGSAAGEHGAAGALGGSTAGAGRSAPAGSGGSSPRPDAGSSDAALVPVGDGEPVSDGNGYVAVGYNSRRILSTDGVSWGSAATFAGPFENLLEGVAIGDGVAVAVGMAGIFRSVDGKAWDQIQSTFMNSVVYHDGVFLALVADSVYRSTDAGKTWARKNGTGGATHWRTAYGNGHWVAVGDKNGSVGVRKVSEDGINWHDYSDQVGFRLNSVAYGAGRFVAVGEGGNGLVTTDGKTWERTDPVGLGDFPVVAFGDGKFVVCAGRCRTSSDGKTWSAPGSGSGPSTHTYGKGQWVGMGDQYYTSADGLRWTAHGGGAGGLEHVRFGRIDGL